MTVLEFLGHPLLLLFVGAAFTALITAGAAWMRTTTSTLRTIEACISSMTGEKAAQIARYNDALLNIEKHQGIQDKRLDRLDSAVFIVAVQHQQDRINNTAQQVQNNLQQNKNDRQQVDNNS